MYRTFQKQERTSAVELKAIACMPPLLRSCLSTTQAAWSDPGDVWYTSSLTASAPAACSTAGFLHPCLTRHHNLRFVSVLSLQHHCIKTVCLPELHHPICIKLTVAQYSLTVGNSGDQTSRIRRTKLQTGRLPTRRVQQIKRQLWRTLLQPVLTHALRR